MATPSFHPPSGGVARRQENAPTQPANPDSVVDGVVGLVGSILTTVNATIAGLLGSGPIPPAN